ncbi:MAG: hypothetical protein VB036_16625 [Propionicimonas sp.]|nr:hypothetical protein [Propionicimonas sp.]
MGPEKIRRPRLSQAETERRVLAAAIGVVNATGLTVSLEHLSFEAVIASAKVSRTAAYRRWPTKESFLHDLIRELARAAEPAAVGMASATVLIRELVRPVLPQLADPAHRWATVVDVVRRAATHDFTTMYTSTQWRTYLALTATFLGLEDDGLRGEVQAALTATQQGFIDRLANSWQGLAAVLGYRLRPGLPGFTSLAALLQGTMRGLILMALANPGIAEDRVDADPFGTGNASWSLAALDCAMLAVGFLEPDPSVIWDDGRVEAVLAALEQAEP